VAWHRFGDVANYVEPFCGTCAVLLANPSPKYECVNDVNGFIANFWRALSKDAYAVFRHCDHPVNECCPAGMMISTPNGDIAIEHIRVGMIVWGEHQGRIVPTRVIATRKSESDASDLRKVGRLRLTANHPVWTTNGYVDAHLLTPGMNIGMICTNGSNGKTLRKMRLGISTKTKRREVLLPRMFFGSTPSSREDVHCLWGDFLPTTRNKASTMLLAKLRSEICLEAQRDNAKQFESSLGGNKDDRSASKNSSLGIIAGKSYLSTKGPKEGADCTTREGVHKPKRREWKRSQYAAKTACRKIGLGYRSRNTDEIGDRKSCSTISVHRGYRGPNFEDCDRSRWSKPQSYGSHNSRRQEGCRPAPIRLESPSVHESRSERESGESGIYDHGRCAVYNFQTETENYFAENILVHNCELHVWEAWMVVQAKKMDLANRLANDPHWYSATLAGRWVWGQCASISGNCGSQKSAKPQLTSARRIGRLSLRDAVKVSHEIPYLSRGGKGVHRPYLHRARGIDNQRIRSEGLLEYLQALGQRLRTVRVCCGDWKRVVTNACTWHVGHPCGVFLDPPYSEKAQRDMSLYGQHDDGDVAHEVREWAIENGNDPRLRIALCGYEGEHEMPEGWTTHYWKAKGGMANTAKKTNTQGRKNRRRERIHFSPHCLPEMRLF